MPKVKKVVKKIVRKPIKKASPVGKGKKPKKEYKFKPSTRAKMSKAHTGKKLSEETKQKISAARREKQLLIEQGYIQPFRHSEETKRHLSKVMKRKKHKPTRKAIKKSAQERASRAMDTRLAKKIAAGKL